ncbi:MAG: CHAT domain-containing protein [Saprospiraceae bacterium]|nr:CHAT domain-containing protein [Saprospiraceae bacterium]
MHDLATVNWQMGRYDESASFLLSARAIEKSMLMDAAGYLSEQELSVLTAQFSSGLNWDFSHAQRNKQISTASYNNILFYKGFLSTTALGINKLAKNDAESSELFDAHKSYRRSLAKEYTKPIEERRNLEELEAKANTVEKELIKHVAGFREASREVFWKDVQDQLHPDEVAIEFVHYISQDITDETSTRYAALVLRPGSAEPTFIDLFEGSEVNDILLETGERRADYINDLYASSNRGLILNGKPKKSMYELIWKPLESNLAGIKTVYYSPSGLLHRINLGAISVNENINLVDQYNLIEVNSTRKLVIPSTVTPISMDAVLFGGINYEPGSEVLALGNAGISPDDLTNRTSLAISSVDSSIHRMAWAPLTWTIPEVESIDKVFRDASFTTVVRRDSEATEESFLTMGQDGSSPCVIHIATHGFFFPDPKSESVASMGIDVSAPVFKRSDNPMIRSGLILAGGNFAWQNGHSIRPDMEDGILTAFEISQMNLYNTELVVLSACETGLGDIQGNEGVYGLQRAFKIAGAKYLIMSLWQVPDRQTMQFMTTFYRHWLEEKLTIPDAFRKTQMEMRDRFFDAYNWAGFVLVE